MAVARDRTFRITSSGLSSNVWPHCAISGIFHKNDGLLVSVASERNRTADELDLLERQQLTNRESLTVRERQQLRYARAEERRKTFVLGTAALLTVIFLSGRAPGMCMPVLFCWLVLAGKVLTTHVVSKPHTT